MAFLPPGLEVGTTVDIDVRGTSMPAPRRRPAVHRLKTITVRPAGPSVGPRSLGGIRESVRQPPCRPRPRRRHRHAGGGRSAVARGAHRPGRARPTSGPSASLDLPAAATEPEVLERLRAMAARNSTLTSMIGMGYSGTHTPSVILRNVLENPAWYTAYTPYQPEISQGRLEALLELPDRGERPDRARADERVDARRGHGRGRGHDAVPPGRQVDGPGVLRRRRLPSPDDRRRRHPGRAPRHRGDRGRSPRRPGCDRRLRPAAPVPGQQRGRARRP